MYGKFLYMEGFALSMKIKRQVFALGNLFEWAIFCHSSFYVQVFSTSSVLAQVFGSLPRISDTEEGFWTFDHYTFYS